MRRWTCALVALTAGCQSGRLTPHTADPVVQARGAVPMAAGVRQASHVELALDRPLATSRPNPPAPPAAVARPAPKVEPLLPPRTAVGGRPLGEPPPEPTPAPPVRLAAEAPVEPKPIDATVPPKASPGKPPVAVTGTFGQGPNYAWLQGVVDRHYRGHLNLRYADPSKEDYWGGKVRLSEDSRLAGLEDGDVIFVEGEVVPAGEAGSGERRDGYPSYRVRAVWVISKRG